MTMNPQWLQWAQRIQSIAQAGLTYGKDPYDIQRYEQLRQIALEMMVDHTSIPRETLTEGLWSLPGGWADPGESPGEVAAREVLEESGYRVRPSKLLAVYDRARHQHPPLIWHVYKMFIRCDLDGGSPETSLETDGAQFFSRDHLPQLSVGRVTEAQIRRMFAHRDAPSLPTDFD